MRKGLMAKYAALPLDKLPSGETARVRRVIGTAKARAE